MSAFQTQSGARTASRCADAVQGDLFETFDWNRSAEPTERSAKIISLFLFNT